jgi:hypothetical protein
VFILTGRGRRSTNLAPPTILLISSRVYLLQQARTLELSTLLVGKRKPGSHLKGFAELATSNVCFLVPKRHIGGKYSFGRNKFIQNQNINMYFKFNICHRVQVITKNHNTVA